MQTQSHNTTPASYLGACTAVLHKMELMHHQPSGEQSECYLLCFVVCNCTGYFGGSDYQKEAEEDGAEEEEEVAESHSC